MLDKFKNIFAKKAEEPKAENLSQEYSVAFVMGDSLMQGVNPEAATLLDYDKMRYDEQVNVCLEVRLQAILGKGWTIDAPEGQEDLADEIYANLQNLKGSFYNTLKQIELAKQVFGFSLSEIIWNVQGGKYTIAAIKTRDSKLIKFYPDKYGDLLEDGIKQMVDGGETPLPAEKMILHVNNMENSNYYGVSALKPAYDAYKNKDAIKRFYNILLERFGIPPIIAKYNPKNFAGKAEAEIKTELQKHAALLKKTHQGGVIMIPDIYESEFIKLDAASGNAFEKALDRYDFAISKGLKVPSELGFLNTKVGSNAKANTQYNLFQLVVYQDKAELEETINEQLIKRYVAYNYGLQDEYPKIKFNPIDAEDIEKIIKLYNEALKSGAIRSTKQGEAKTLELLGYPEIPEGEEDLLKTKPVVDPNNQDNQPPDPPQKEGGKQKFAKKSFNGWELDAFQQKVDFAKIENFLDEKENALIGQILDLVDEIEIDVTNKIINKKIVSEQKFGEIEKLQIKGSYTGNLKTIFQKYLTQAAKEGKATFLEEMQPQKFAVPRNELLEPEYLAFILALSKELAGEITAAYLIETKKILFVAIQDGWTEKKLIQALQEVYSPAAQADGVAKPAMPKSRLQVIARTNLNAVFNKGRHIQALQLNDKTNSTYYKQFTEVMDDRSHPFSLFINGKCVRVGTELDQRLQYPMHYNDRGVAVYINADIEGEPENILTSMPNLARYSGMLVS